MILIAENLTVTRADVARAVERRDPGPIIAVAGAARASGARYIDVNLGRGRDREGAHRFVLEVLSGCWEGGILLDTADPGLMASVAGSWTGPLVLNGFSGDPGREGVLEVAARHDLEVVVFLMASGVPRDVDDRLVLAAELLARCGQAGVPAERVWIDPVVVPLGWTDGQMYNRNLLEVLRRLPDLLGLDARSVIGLSNLTTGAATAGRVPWLEEVFLAAAAGAGLTHAMVDVTRGGVVRTARALDVLEARRLFAPGEFADDG